MKILKLILMVAIVLTQYVLSSEAQTSLSLTDGIEEEVIVIDRNTFFSESRSGNEINFSFLIDPGISGMITFAKKDVDENFISEGFSVDLNHLNYLLRKKDDGEIEVLYDMTILNAFTKFRNGPAFCGDIVLKTVVEASNGLEATISFHGGSSGDTQWCDARIFPYSTPIDFLPKDFCPAEECIIYYPRQEGGSGIEFGHCDVEFILDIVGDNSRIDCYCNTLWDPPAQK